MGKQARGQASARQKIEIVQPLRNRGASKGNKGKQQDPGSRGDILAAVREELADDSVVPVDELRGLMLKFGFKPAEVANWTDEEVVQEWAKAADHYNIRTEVRDQLLKQQSAGADPDVASALKDLVNTLGVEDTDETTGPKLTNRQRKALNKAAARANKSGPVAGRGNTGGGQAGESKNVFKVEHTRASVMFGRVGSAQLEGVTYGVYYGQNSGAEDRTGTAFKVVAYIPELRKAYIMPNATLAQVEALAATYDHRLDMATRVLEVKVPSSLCKWKYQNTHKNVLMCYFQGTKSYMQNMFGGSIGSDDETWYRGHPLTEQGGLPKCYTLTVGDALVRPYNLGISEVWLRKGTPLSDEHLIWQQILGINPAAAADSTTTDDEWEAQQLSYLEHMPEDQHEEFRVHVAAQKAGFKFHYTDVLPTNRALVTMESGFAGPGAGGGGGHATYRGPRSDRNFAWEEAVAYDRIENCVRNPVIAGEFEDGEYDKPVVLDLLDSRVPGTDTAVRQRIRYNHRPVVYGSGNNNSTGAGVGYMGGHSGPIGTPLQSAGERERAAVEQRGQSTASPNASSVVPDLVIGGEQYKWDDSVGAYKNMAPGSNVIVPAGVTGGEQSESSTQGGFHSSPANTHSDRQGTARSRQSSGGTLRAKLDSLAPPVLRAYNQFCQDLVGKTAWELGDHELSVTPEMTNEAHQEVLTLWAQHQMEELIVNTGFTRGEGGELTESMQEILIHTPFGQDRDNFLYSLMRTSVQWASMFTVMELFSLFSKLKTSLKDTTIPSLVCKMMNCGTMQEAMELVELFQPVARRAVNTGRTTPAFAEDLLDEHQLALQAMEAEGGGQQGSYGETLADLVGQDASATPSVSLEDMNDQLAGIHIQDQPGMEWREVSPASSR